MKQLYNKLITTNHFENVICITVSSKLTFQKIQTDIAKNIGLFDAGWAEKSSEEKSETIRATMRGKKFVLFLDDLWFRLDLTALGVEGSKFIYSSRSKLMLMGDCSAVFTLKKLSEADAWQLFRHKVGDENLRNQLFRPRYMEVARNLVRLCNGLPILISTLGRAMGSDKEWRYALVRIKIDREFTRNNEVKSIFKLCFDCFPNSITRSCLLYFSMFPEDFTIHKKDLIDFWICEQLLFDKDSTDDALIWGYNAMNTLIEAGFLEEEEENDCVKLLDMIRDFALSRVIKYRMFMNSKLLEKPDVRATLHLSDCPCCLFTKVAVTRSFRVKRETTVWISSMGNSIGNVPPNLLPFLLNYDPFVMIKHKPSSGMYDNFRRLISPRLIMHRLGMYDLTVLDLSNSGIEEVPLELSRLVSLQYLNLSHTWIVRLPIELKMLQNLKCLNLEYDDQLRVIPKKLISSLLSLQVLKMFRCGFSVEELESNILSIRNIDINPLLLLEHLEVLSITITSISALHKLSNNLKLLNCTQIVELLSISVHKLSIFGV